MMEVDQAVAHVERLYKSITETDAPPQTEKPYAAIPPEKDPQRHVEEQMERLVAMLPGATAPGQAATGVPAAVLPWAPPIAVWESPEEVCICFDVPGVPRQAVTVQVVQNALAVSGERPRPAAETFKGGAAAPRWIERPYGRFVRVVPLPAGAAPEQLDAQVRDGVLEIRIPRAAPAAATAKAVPVR